MGVVVVRLRKDLHQTTAFIQIYTLAVAVHAAQLPKSGSWLTVGRTDTKHYKPPTNKMNIKLQKKEEYNNNDLLCFN